MRGLHEALVPALRGGGELGDVLVHPSRVNAARGKILVAENILQERDVGAHTFQPELGQCPQGPRHRVGQIGRRRVCDDLGEQRVEGGARAISGVAEAVGPHSGAVRRLVDAQRATGREDGSVRTDGLHVHPSREGVATRPGAARGVEPERSQRRARGEADLGLHEIDAGDLFGDGVLHLQACVGLDEHEGSRTVAVRVIDQELEGAQIAVACFRRETNGGLDDASPELVADAWCRSHLDHLLVAALDAAFALAEVCERAAAITEDLDLHVARSRQELLDIDVFTSERRPGLRLAALECGLQLCSLRDSAGATTSATGDGLDDHRSVRTE